MNDFVTKDSGNRVVFKSGMQRDVTTGKTDFTYCIQGPMLERWAQLMERGAVKYERDNWMKAEGEAELERFRSSAMRHMIQYLRGDTDEDHAAAVIFNLNGAEYVKAKMAQPKLEDILKPLPFAPSQTLAEALEEAARTHPANGVTCDVMEEVHPW